MKTSKLPYILIALLAVLGSMLMALPPSKTPYGDVGLKPVTTTGPLTPGNILIATNPNTISSGTNTNSQVAAAVSFIGDWVDNITGMFSLKNLFAPNLTVSGTTISPSVVTGTGYTYPSENASAIPDGTIVEKVGNTLVATGLSENMTTHIIYSSDNFTLSSNASFNFTNWNNGAAPTSAGPAIDAAAAEAHYGSNVDMVVGGMLPIKYAGTYATATPTQYHMYAGLIVVSRSMTFDEALFQVTTLKANTGCHLELYNNSATYPTSLVEDFGIVSTATTGIKAQAISPVLTLAAGSYWMVATDNATDTVQVTGCYGVGPQGNNLGLVPTDFTNSYIGYESAQSVTQYNTAPSTFPLSAGLSSGGIPLMGLRISALN